MSFDFDEIWQASATSPRDNSKIEFPISVTVGDMVLIQDALNALIIMENNSAIFAEYRGENREKKFHAMYAASADFMNDRITEFLDFVDRDI